MKTSATLLAALAPFALGVELCDKFGYFADHGYGYNNNAWGDDGSGSGCTYIDSTTDSGVAWHAAWSWGGDPNSVKQYPYGGRQIDVKTVASINSIPTSAKWSYTGGVSRADVAYDLFTAADPNHDKSSGDYELMIWLAAIGGVQPIGPSVGQVNVGGQNWDLHIGPNGAMTVFSFVATEQRNEFNTDVKQFFNTINGKNGFDPNTQHLITLQFGTEAFTGSGAQFNVDHWDGNIN